VEGQMTISNQTVERCIDLLPCFRTKLSMISDEGKGNEDVEEQAYGSGDDRGAETDRGRAQSRRCGARSRSIEAHDLCLEGEVRRHGCEPGAGGEAVARREHAATEVGGRPEPGQGRTAVGD